MLSYEHRHVGENATLFLGDCMRIFPTFLDGEVDMLYTDPPYGLNYESDVFDRIEGDEQLPVDWIPEAFRVLKEGGAFYCFAHWTTWSVLEAAVKEVGFQIKNMIVMNKSNHGRGDLEGAYAPKHELLLFATKGRHTLRFPYGRTNDIWEARWFSPVNPQRLHATEKPVSWWEPGIFNSSRVGDLILDPFMGSASCGEACMKHGRRYAGIEISEAYFAAACKRLELVAQANQTSFINDEMEQEALL